VLNEIVRRVNAAGHLAFPNAVFLKDDTDPGRGLAFNDNPPRFSTGYMILENRPGLLVELHMLKQYRARVTGDYEIMRALLELLNQHASRLVDLNLNYTLLDARDLDTGGWLPYRSRNTVTSSLDVLGGLAGVDVLYRSRLEAVTAYPGDPRGDVTVVDARVAFRLAKAVMQVKVSNLLQARYVDVLERNEGAPRSLLVTGIAAF
jgi:hypothetical protein